jgi:hypothetical protein
MIQVEDWAESQLIKVMKMLMQRIFGVKNEFISQEMDECD